MTCENCKTEGVDRITLSNGVWVCRHCAKPKDTKMKVAWMIEPLGRGHYKEPVTRAFRDWAQGLCYRETEKTIDPQTGDIKMVDHKISARAYSRKIFVMG